MQIPLLKDHHAHPFMTAVLRDCINLNTALTKKEALSLIKRGEEDINVILGWYNTRYTFEQEELEQLPPVVICNKSFHSFLINQAAREKLSVTHPEMAMHIDDKLWVDKNLSNILNVMASLHAYTPEKIKRFFYDILQLGVWFLEEMLLPNEHAIEVLKALGYLNRTRLWADLETYQALSQAGQNEVYGIKLFLDGAIASFTAALSEPYLNGKQGRLVYSDEALRSFFNQVMKLNKPVALHAIGDRAIAQAIGILSEIKKGEGKIPLTRLEHVQLISQELARQAKELGIILSMQPNFSREAIQYEQRLSEKYLKGHNPFRMLIDEIGFVPGEDLILGSDGMPYGVENAYKSALFPPFPSQQLSLDEFVRGYCLPDKSEGYIEISGDEQFEVVLHT
jgi:predicted amidohydrolase YtcJ